MRLDGELITPRLVRRSGRSVQIALVSGRALLLPGDEVMVRIVIGPGCSVTLTDIGGLVVYGRPGRSEQSHFTADIRVDAGAQLNWNALPTVITRDGTLIRDTRVHLAAGAGATWRETLVLGRSGEAGGSVTASTHVTDDHGPVLVEQLVTSGSEHAPGVLGNARVTDTLLAVGAVALLDSVAGATLLQFQRGGSALRFLGERAHTSPLGAAWPTASSHPDSAPTNSAPTDTAPTNAAPTDSPRTEAFHPDSVPEVPSAPHERMLA